MKKTIFSALILLSLFVLIIRFGYGPALKFLGFESRAGFKITSVPTATVFISGQEVGQTPYESDDFSPGEAEVKLVAGSAVWQGFVKLNRGAVTIINRELLESTASSSGEVVTIEKGKGAVILSNPTGAEVSIDGTKYGVAPISIDSLTPGEHTFLLTHANYASRSIKATVPEQMALFMNIDLAMSGILAVPTQIATPKVIIGKTPTGFLRVRNKASVAGAEVGQVLPDQRLTLLDEVPGWFKILLPSGITGFISSTYAQKQ